MSRKKHNVVSAKWCTQMEQLRVALEVYLGKRVRFKQIDFDKKTATVFVGIEPEEKKVFYQLIEGEVSNIRFKDDVGYANVLFNKEGTVAVYDLSLHAPGDPHAWLGWGYAPEDRRLQSLKTVPGTKLI